MMTGIYKGRLIRLDFGEPSLPCPPEAKAEAIKYITNPECYYSPIKGENKLIDQIQKYLFNEKKFNISRKLITITTGGLMGLNSIIRCLKKEGVKKIYYPDPGFPPYRYIEYYNEIELVPYPLNNEKKAIDFLIKSTNKNPHKSVAYIINSPNNPNGITFSNTSWKCLKEGIINQYIICDNSFEAFIYNKSKKNSFPPFGENFFHVFSFSKTFSLADYRVGYVVSPNKEWAELISRHHWFTQLSTSVISQQAAIGALNCKSDYLNQNIITISQNLNYSIEQLKKNNIDGYHPEGGFFLWINIDETQYSSNEFTKYA